jgi:hypothetical protein
LFAPTAPTQFVEANGIRFAYRRFGEPDSVPLVLIQHFTDTMDHWDPAVTDGLAPARSWLRSRQRRRKSSAAPMTSPIIFGFALRWRETPLEGRGRPIGVMAGNISSSRRFANQALH